MLDLPFIGPDKERATGFTDADKVSPGFSFQRFKPLKNVVVTATLTDAIFKKVCDHLSATLLSS
jgi:hypothetical protein